MSLFHLKALPLMSHRYVLCVWVIAILMNASNVLALDMPDLVEDPLLANPVVLSSGPRLPDNAPLPCPANLNFSKPLALGEAVDVALCNNPQIAAAWAQIKIDAAGVGQARSAYLPTVNGSFSRLKNANTYFNSQIPDAYTLGNQIYGSFNWRLFDFGGRGANRESANQLLLAALAGHDATLQKVMASVIQAYFDVLTNQAITQARTQMATLAQNTYQATLRKENKGAVALSDSLQAATALAKAQLTAARATGDYQKSLGVLKQAMGIAAATNIHVSSQAQEMAPSNPESKQATPAGVIDPKLDEKDLNAWLLEAEQKHPAIMQARAKWESDKVKIVAMRSEGMPTIDATAYVSQNGYPNQGLSSINQRVTAGGFTVSFPLFEGFGRTYKIRSAQAQAEQSVAQLEYTTQQILLDVVKAHADALTSLSTVKASEQLLQTAKIGVQSSQRRYQYGAADILELLNAQSALADAQQESIRANAEYRSAKLRLLANTGILGGLHLSDPFR